MIALIRELRRTDGSYLRLCPLFCSKYAAKLPYWVATPNPAGKPASAAPGSPTRRPHLLRTIVGFFVIGGFFVVAFVGIVLFIRRAGR